MNKTIFFSGLSFFILEALAFLGIIASQINVSKQTFAIGIFGLLNIVFAILMLVGALKEE